MRALRDDPHLREEYKKLFEEFPDTTIKKFEDGGRLDTAGGAAHVLVQLATNLHKGEVVELDPDRSRWRLVERAPGSASAHEQFYCVPGGSPVARPPRRCYEWRRPTIPTAEEDFAGQIATLRLRLRDYRKEHSDYAPDWSQQQFRALLR